MVSFQSCIQSFWQDRVLLKISEPLPVHSHNCIDLTSWHMCICHSQEILIQELLCLSIYKKLFGCKRAAGSVLSVVHIWLFQVCVVPLCVSWVIRCPFWRTSPSSWRSSQASSKSLAGCCPWLETNSSHLHLWLKQWQSFCVLHVGFISFNPFCAGWWSNLHSLHKNPALQEVKIVITMHLVSAYHVASCWWDYILVYSLFAVYVFCHGACVAVNKSSHQGQTLFNFFNNSIGDKLGGPGRTSIPSCFPKSKQDYFIWQLTSCFCPLRPV